MKRRYRILFGTGREGHDPEGTKFAYQHVDKVSGLTVGFYAYHH